MFVRQLFNQSSFSYTYLIADENTLEAVLIDPVKDKLMNYVQLFNELGLSAVAAIDTHAHDDRESALTALRDLWGCEAIAGSPTKSIGLTRTVKDGSIIKVGETRLIAVHTPGHSVDSYCYLADQPGKISLFSGDTLLVRTLGLSNQPTSDIETHYHSLFNIILKLPDETLIYPGRDFKGWPMSTIAEEKSFNPYLQAASMEEFMRLKQAQQPAQIEPLLEGSRKTAVGGDFTLVTTEEEEPKSSDETIPLWR